MTIEVRPHEMRGIAELGLRNPRRLDYHDPLAPGWAMIGRLHRSPEVINTGLGGPLAGRGRRTMLDVVAMLPVRRLEAGRTFGLRGPRARGHRLAHDRAEFRHNAPPCPGSPRPLRTGRSGGRPLPGR